MQIICIKNSYLKLSLFRNHYNYQLLEAIYVVAPDRALSMDQIELNCVLKLELFDQTEELEIEVFFTIKLGTYI